MHKKLIFAAVYGIATITFHPLTASADIGEQITKATQTLKKLSIEIRQKAIPLLTVIKELEKGKAPPRIETAKVIKPLATIRETDNPESGSLFLARLNDEFPVIGQRDQWYRVSLEDGREGWIHESVVQVFASQVSTEARGGIKITSMQIREMLALMADLMNDINARNEAAKQILSRWQKTYDNLSSEQRQQYLSAYQTLVQEGEKINKYYNYAQRFFSPYADMVNLKRREVVSRERTFKGQASFNLGKSTYESAVKESEIARQLTLNGILMLDEKSCVTASIANRNEVIQTPFASTDMRVGYTYRQNGISINSKLAYNRYTDKNLARNNFGQINAGINVNYPLRSGPQLFGYFNHVRKMYQQENGNSYASSQFNIGASIKKKMKSEMTLNLQGIIQSSNISYLEFNQFKPTLIYLRNTSKGNNFGATTQIDYIGYAPEAKDNNYIREQVDFKWTATKKGRERTTLLKIIGKQFPYNKQLNYIKLVGNMQWRGGVIGFGQSSSTSIFTILTIFPSTEGNQVDYFDLRLDQMNSSERYYLNFSLFSRLWSKPGGEPPKDHTVDLYSRFGPIYSNMRVGPICISKMRIGPTLGIHLLFGSGGSLLKKDGNSLRAGLGFQSYLKIKTTAVNINSTYERALVYGNEVEINPITGEMEVGKVVDRQPTSIQLDIGTSTPISRNLDLRFTLSYYNISPDVSEKTSIYPVENRSKLKFLGGLAYRFGLYHF